MPSPEPVQITPEKRVQMFANLAHQYRVGTEWARQQETNTYTELINGHEQERKILSDELYAGRLWRLGLLRKFVVKGETVQVPQVLTDLRVLLRDKLQSGYPQERKVIGSLIEEFSGAAGDMGAYAVLDRAGSFRDVMTDILYGVVLHADPDRYDRLYDHANAPFAWSMVVSWLDRTEKSLFKITEYVDQFSVEFENGQRHVWPWWPPAPLASEKTE